MKKTNLLFLIFILSILITACEGSDLIVTHFFIRYYSFYNTFTISSRVQNIGDQQSGATMEYFFLKTAENGTTDQYYPLASTEIPALSPDYTYQTPTLYISVSTEGVDDIFTPVAYVDYTDEVPEDIESNNYIISDESFHIMSALPDLVIAEQSLVSPVVAGDDISYEITVANFGNRIEEVSSALSIFISPDHSYNENGELIQTVDLTDIGVDSESTDEPSENNSVVIQDSIEYTGLTAGEQYYIYFVVDIDDEIEELSEENNISYQKLVVY